MSPRSHLEPATAAADRALARMALLTGQLIRDERRRRRWSLAAVAGRAGHSPAHVAQIEAGKPASLESYARLITALDLEPTLGATDPRRRPDRRLDEDFVHAAMGEVQAKRLQAAGFQVRVDEPYQHYQFAGRADVVAWDPARRALLHIENRTRFPNVQEALGSFGAKRAYLGRILAERFEVRGGWRSETHVIAALWTSEVIHVLRSRRATFDAACGDRPAALRAWWDGDVGGVREASSTLVLFDPSLRVREGFRFAVVAEATRPRYRGYAEAAAAIRSEAGAADRVPAACR